MENENRYGIDEAVTKEMAEHPGRRAMSRRLFTKVLGVSAAALALAGGAGALAWFTGRDTKENKIEIARNLNIRVVEPKWDTAGEWGEAGKDQALAVVPGKHIPKNPQIENLSDEFPGYMVVEIRVPAATNVKVFDEATQAVVERDRIPLFTFEPSSEWVALQEFDNGGDIVYRFGWPDPIPAMGTTPSIFEEVVFAPLAEAQGYSGEKTVTATGYGIQSEGLDNVEEAWEAYKKQNGIGDGEEPDLPPTKTVNAVTLGNPGNRILMFTESAPGKGDIVNGLEVCELVEDVESLEACAMTPLTSTPAEIKSVIGEVPMAPVCTDNWFNGLANCERIIVPGLDSSMTESSNAMFENSPGLILVEVGEKSIVDGLIPENLDQTGPYRYELIDKESWQFWFEENGDKWLGPNQIVAAANDIAAKGQNSEYYDQYRGFMATQRTMYIQWSETEIYKAQIAGINQEIRADGGGVAGLTFMFVDVLDSKARMNVANWKGGWRDSEIRFRMNPPEITYDAELSPSAVDDHEIWESAPYQLRSAVKVVNKLTRNPREQEWSDKLLEGSTTADAFWLPSITELVKSYSKPAEEYEMSDPRFMYQGEGTLMELCNINEVLGGHDSSNMSGFKNALLSKKYHSLTGKPTWWTRTLNYPSWAEEYAPAYQLVYTNGVVCDSYEQQESRMAICPCFCL